MEPRLVQHQSQKLILSPQIRQYLKVLQMPVAELEQAVETELSENPVLEELDPAKNEEPLPSSAEPPIEEKPKAELELSEAFEKLGEMGESLWENENSDYADFSRTDPKDMQKKKDYEESLITKPEALSDFLLWQIRFLDFTEDERRIAEEIVGNIDEEGYLKATVEEIAQSCHAEIALIQKILDQIQDLDPPGIGARNLQEALLLQLKKKGSDAVLAIQIVSDYLPLLEKRDWHQLAKILAVDIQEVKKAADLIARLEPKPGRTFYVEEPIAVTPDATITRSDDENEKFKIEIHDERIPSLRINPYYRRLLRDKNTDEKAKIFLREKIESAINFLKALTLRKSTLREITTEILRVQLQFFEKGFSHLVPLRLKDIANALGIHESTVSRALQRKYISTPQGTIPYKSFFSTRLETVSGEAESQKSITEKIRTMIDNEDTKNPLSDQEIMRHLQNEGLVIARRTVAKYRDLLKILPSHLRRKR